MNLCRATYDVTVHANLSLRKICVTTQHLGCHFGHKEKQVKLNILPPTPHCYEKKEDEKEKENNESELAVKPTTE